MRIDESQNEAKEKQTDKVFWLRLLFERHAEQKKRNILEFYAEYLILNVDQTFSER